LPFYHDIDIKCGHNYEKYREQQRYQFSCCFFVAHDLLVLLNWNERVNSGESQMNTNKPALPGRCYWVIPDRFLAGSFPYNPGIDNPHDFLLNLLGNKIDAFIDLTEEDELVHYQPVLAGLTGKDILYMRFAIVDYSIPELEEMQQIVSTINSLLEAGQRIYLHCRGGIGRTGTVVGCWLKNQGYDSETALAELSQLFSASNAARFTSSPETKEQRDFVRSFLSGASKP